MQQEIRICNSQLLFLDEVILILPLSFLVLPSTYLSSYQNSSYQSPTTGFLSRPSLDSHLLPGEQRYRRIWTRWNIIQFVQVLDRCSFLCHARMVPKTLDLLLKYRRALNSAMRSSQPAIFQEWTTVGQGRYSVSGESLVGAYRRVSASCKLSAIFGGFVLGESDHTSGGMAHFPNWRASAGAKRTKGQEYEGKCWDLGFAALQEAFPGTEESMEVKALCSICFVIILFSELYTLKDQGRARM